MTPTKILLVEDEDAKRQHIERHLLDVIPEANFVIAKSVKSGLIAIEKERFGLLILDMSLPTFDVHASESGGRPRGFGGREILQYMDLEEIQCPTIVLTGYEAFSDPSGDSLDLSDLRAELFESFSTNVIAVLHFSSTVENWKSELSRVLEGL